MKRVFCLFLAAAAFAAAAPAGAEPPTATRLVFDKSQIAFVSKQMGVPVEGTFKKFDAQVAFDPPKAAPSRCRSTPRAHRSACR
jgi:polyisoprenoid-binding protein YceI